MRVGMWVNVIYTIYINYNSYGKKITIYLILTK